MPVEVDKLAQGAGLGYESSKKRQKLGNGPPGFELPDSVPLPPPTSPSRYYLDTISTIHPLYCFSDNHAQEEKQSHVNIIQV